MGFNYLLFIWEKTLSRAGKTSGALLSRKSDPSFPKLEEELNERPKTSSNPYS